MERFLALGQISNIMPNYGTWGENVKMLKSLTQSSRAVFSQFGPELMNLFEETKRYDLIHLDSFSERHVEILKGSLLLYHA